MVGLVKYNNKSTSRFYDPQNGSIEIDNQNIKDVSLGSLRKIIFSKSGCYFI